jgi:ABC-type multidrug transport system ATPase subunit
MSGKPVDIRGYDYLFDFRNYKEIANAKENDLEVRYTRLNEESQLSVIISGKEVYKAPLQDFIKQLRKKYPVEKLSGGMKKRLSIACALAKDPPILILDEPGASLDIVCKEDIKNYLKSYLKNGGTVIITSHEEAELDLCNRMYLLQNGVLTELPNKPVGHALMERMTAFHG